MVLYNSLQLGIVPQYIIRVCKVVKYIEPLEKRKEVQFMVYISSNYSGHN